MFFGNTLDGMVLDAPHPQNELDLFRKEWAYDIPVDDTHSGACSQFRFKHTSICLLEAAFGKMYGWNVLELGPNEGEVSFHLHHAGVARVLSIEARVRTYLKALIVKNLLKLDTVTYMLGDFTKHLESTKEHYDLILASGVMYHMIDPVRVIHGMCKRAERLSLATFYFGPEMLEYDASMDKSGLPPVVWDVPHPEGHPHRYGGLEVQYYKYYYPISQDLHEGYGHGGPAMYANLLNKDDLIRAIEFFGFEIVEPTHDDPQGCRGPHIHLQAQRRKPKALVAVPAALAEAPAEGEAVPAVEGEAAPTTAEGETVPVPAVEGEAVPAVEGAAAPVIEGEPAADVIAEQPPATALSEEWQTAEQPAAETTEGQPAPAESPEPIAAEATQVDISLEAPAEVTEPQPTEPVPPPTDAPAEPHEQPS